MATIEIKNFLLYFESSLGVLNIWNWWAICSIYLLPYLCLVNSLRSTLPIDVNHRLRLNYIKSVSLCDYCYNHFHFDSIFTSAVTFSTFNSSLDHHKIPNKLISKPSFMVDFYYQNDFNEIWCREVQ